jgi:acyl-CoA thioester hydrolase
MYVGHIGRSSVRYEIAVFDTVDEVLSATGSFVHVFVDRENRRPVPIPAAMRERLELLRVDEDDSLDDR